MPRKEVFRASSLHYKDGIDKINALFIRLISHGESHCLTLGTVIRTSEKVAVEFTSVWHNDRSFIME